MIRRRRRDGHWGAEDVAQNGLGFLPPRAHLGALANQLRSGVADDEAFLFQQLAALTQQLGAGNPVVLWPAHANEGAEVAEVGGGKQSVDKRVAHHVPIGVALAAIHVLEEEACDPAGFSGLNLVGVGGDSHARDNRVSH